MLYDTGDFFVNDCKKIDIKENASDEEVAKKISAAKLEDFFKEEYKFTV